MNLYSKPPLDELTHYGIKRRSGRYPWGSGEDPYQHSSDFLARIQELKEKGMKETDIAKSMGLTTTQLRTQKALAKNERRKDSIATAKRLRDKEGMSNSEIARKMGINESSVRSLLNESSEKNTYTASVVAEQLKKAINEKGMIDIGAGVERELGVSREKLNEALYILEREGYPNYTGSVAQVTNAGQQTILKVIGPPGTEYKDIYQTDKVHSYRDYSNELDKLDSIIDKYPEHPDHFIYPTSINHKRVSICYAEEGGIEKDGLIEIRRGVDDLSLGNSHYAQVRIMVDDPTNKETGKSYLKGMAVYSDDLPEGVDIRFNTNKKVGTPMNETLKPVKDDPENPFGSLIKQNGQSYYYKDGKQYLSAINKRAEEGDWNQWSNQLPSQFLSKQNESLIKRQLGIARDERYKEYDEIMALTNPTVKKVLLESFASDCDSAAVHLKAAALPRQKYKVIIPVPELKDNEIYAPTYNDGEKVALVRYPHGGTFEIPILTVNNKHKKGKSVLGDATDAVGINSKVAERLSGADFDGDSVMVIPTNSKVKITSTKRLDGLVDFDSKQYKIPKGNPEGAKFMKSGSVGLEMGKISNLITDMTLKGANEDELARAVRHSMVVIDAYKHGLNYKQSEKDNNIQQLKEKYQKAVDENGRVHYGAGTLISRAKAQTSVGKRRGNAWINEETGALEWERVNKKTGEFESKYTNETYIDKVTGKEVKRTQKSTKMAETNDARTLSSGHPKEEAYASYANDMKALANKARKSMIDTGRLTHNKEAQVKYQKEYSELMAQLNVSLKNAPKERQAQLIANSIAKEKILANPDLTSAEKKKIKQQALNKARIQVGAKRNKIDITEAHWEAIQAGAISENKLMQILNNADIDKVREYATPRATTILSEARINKLKTMKASGNYTTAEIAKALGVSVSTVQNYA